MKNTAVITDYIRELEAEAIATRKCLERIPETKFHFKPHPTSMTMGYLTLLVAEIPKWIWVMIEDAEIDFATYKHEDIKTTKAMLEHFDMNMEGAKKALQNASEEDLEKTFYLRSDGKELFSARIKEYIGATINHWIHHRGQLTVYMRISEIPVPSIYGPSADDKNF